MDEGTEIHGRQSREGSNPLSEPRFKERQLIRMEAQEVPSTMMPLDHPSPQHSSGGGHSLPRREPRPRDIQGLT